MANSIIIEQFQELIERDSQEISMFWKFAQMLSYACCAGSGYTSAILFYKLLECFDTNCILWAVPKLMTKPLVKDEDDAEAGFTTVEPFVLRAMNLEGNLDIHAWHPDIAVHLGEHIWCAFCAQICLSSCVFGVVGFALFGTCGRGGYDNRMFTEPWRVVVPAIIFNFIGVVLSSIAEYNIEKGFLKFIRAVERLSGIKGCVGVMEYAKPFYKQPIDLCNYFESLQVTAWIMVISWAAGLSILILRVINVTDFRLLKVSVRRIPKNRTQMPKGLKRLFNDMNETTNPVLAKKIKMTDAFDVRRNTLTESKTKIE